VLRSGKEMLYVPDVNVVTIEYPPSANFFVGSTILMRRWFGNMMRNGSRAIALGPKPMGFFVWWCLIDQRIGVWTSLIGPVGAICLSLSVSPFAILVYLYWVALTRFLQCLLLLNVRREVSWTYPFLLYFNQVYGALVKTYILFRLNKQSWTRQKTAARSSDGQMEAALKAASSRAMHVLSLSAFVLFVAFYVNAFHLNDLLSFAAFNIP
jgi:mannuronan synthase